MFFHIFVRVSDVDRTSLAKPLWVLIALYFAASLAHFGHNAEYIAYYPNLPGWLTREKVYLFWLAITAIGAAGVVLLHLHWRGAALACLLVYGAMGLDGLGHYSLALCVEHTLAMNLTIWAEAATGVALAAGCLLALLQRLRRVPWPAS
jgi:hypothetical protein